MHLAALLWLLVGAGPLEAPSSGPGEALDDPISVTVNRLDGSAIVSLGDPLASGRVEGALDSGLPVRIHVVTELWRDRLVDSEEGREEWRATVVHDPLEDEYRLEMEGTALERHQAPSLDEVRGLLNRRVPVALEPSRDGRFYYRVTVEVETLSLSDLDELERWLRGDLGAAAEGEERVEGALSRGFRRLFLRLVGAPVERFEVQSETFRHPLEDLTRRGSGPPHRSAPPAR